MFMKLLEVNKKGSSGRNNKEAWNELTPIS